MYKQAYLLGDMLHKGSQLLRAKETKESNADLYTHIFKKDIDNIYTSDLIIANPQTICRGN